MNHIQEIRDEIQRHFNPDDEISGCREILWSPSGNYRVETKAFKQKAPKVNWEVSNVEIFDVKHSKLVLTFFVSESTFFHSWVTKNGIEYLLCAEDLCGGQTVIDLTNNKIASFSANDDGFIWTKHLLSPDQDLLAVFGCGWGSASFVIVYYFDNPMDLPLKIAYEPEWTGYDILEWIDNKRIKVKKTGSSEPTILELESGLNTKIPGEPGMH